MNVSTKYEFLKATYKAQIADLVIAGESDESNAVMTLLQHKHKAASSAVTMMQAAKWRTEDAGKKGSYDLSAEKLDQYQSAIFDSFASMLDPTHNRRGAGKSYKYLHWICTSFLTYRHNNRPMLIEDFYKHHNNLRDFEAWSGRLHGDGLPNQIDDPLLAQNGFKALETLITPYQNHRAAKREEKRLRRMTPEQKVRIDRDSTVIYDGSEGKIIMVHSWEASQHHGSRTKWCITQRDHDHFTGYNRRHPITFYIPTSDAKDYSDFPSFHSFKFAAAENSFWNELDQQQYNHFPSCLHRLAQAAQQHLQDQPTITEYLSKFAHIDTILDDSGIPITAKPAISLDSPPEDWKHAFYSIAYGENYETIQGSLNLACGCDEITRKLHQDHPDLMQEDDFIRYICGRHIDFITHVEERFRDDDILAEHLSRQHMFGSNVKYMSDRIRGTAAYFITNIKTCQTDYGLYGASDEVCARKDIIELALEYGDRSSSVILDKAWPNIDSNSWRSMFNSLTNMTTSRLPNLRDDRDLVIKAVKKNPRNLEYASKRLRNDAEIVDLHPDCYRHASHRLRADKKRAERAIIEGDSWNSEKLPRRLARDQKFMLDLLKKGADVTFLLRLHHLRKNPDFIKKALDIGGRVLWITDESVIKKHATEDWLLTSLAAGDHNAFDHWGDLAANQDLSPADKELQRNAFFERALEINGNVLFFKQDYTGEKYKDNLTAGLKAIETAPYAFRHVSSFFFLYQEMAQHNPQVPSTDTLFFSLCKRLMQQGNRHDCEQMIGNSHGFASHPRMNHWMLENDIRADLLPYYIKRNMPFMLDQAQKDRHKIMDCIETRREDASVARNIVQHYIETNRSAELLPYLRHMPVLRSDPAHFMSCDAALDYLDTRADSAFEWPAFDRMIDMYRGLMPVDADQSPLTPLPAVANVALQRNARVTP